MSESNERTIINFQGTLFENKHLQVPDLCITDEEYSNLQMKWNQQKIINKTNNYLSKKFVPSLKSTIISYIFNKQFEHANGVIEPSFLAFLTDSEGTISAFSCSEDVAPKIPEIGIVIGTNLSLQSAGINAQSAAMELHRPVFMRHTKHSLSVFWDWACICVPIIDKSNTLLGYLAISTYCTVAVQRYYSLLLHISRAIANYQTLEETISTKIDQLSLTKRQKEVCWYWIHDYDYKEIAQQLFISPNTVRVIVSQINESLAVTSKLSMLLKVLEGHYL